VSQQGCTGWDVVHGQTAWSLRHQDERCGPERNRHQPPPSPLDQLYWSWHLWADLAVADLSVHYPWPLVLPALRKWLVAEQAEAVVLVKPQFEVGKARGRQEAACVRDPVAMRCLEAVITAAAGTGTGWLQGWWPHRFTGPAGNHVNTCSGSGPGSQQSFEDSIRNSDSIPW